MSNNFRRPPPVERKSAVDAMAEAANRPLDFNPEERLTFLKGELKKVMEMQDEGVSAAEIRAAVPVLVERFPELFKKVTTPGEDLTPLLSMFGLMEKMGSGELTHHNASVLVGQGLAAKYMPAHLRDASASNTDADTE
jgi:hypothetical protein